MSRCLSDKQGHFSITDTLEKMGKNEIAGLWLWVPLPLAQRFCFVLFFSGSRNSSLFLSSSAMYFIFCFCYTYVECLCICIRKGGSISCLPWCRNLFFILLENYFKHLAISQTFKNTSVFLKYHFISVQSVFPGGSEGEASACNVGDLGSIPWWGRSPGEGNSNPLQYSGKSHGQRSLVGYSPWSRKEWDMTERLHFTSSVFKVVQRLRFHAPNTGGLGFDPCSGN